MAFPDIWTKYYKVSISKLSGSEIAFGARVKDVAINFGSRPGASIAGVDGSRLWADGVQEDGTVTMKIYPVSVDSATASGGLFQAFVGGTADASEPLHTDTTTAGLIRDTFRVTVLWTNDAANTGAAAAVTINTQALRFYAADCRITDFEMTPSDETGIEISVTLKFPPRNASGVTNFAISSCTSAALAALSSYTASGKQHSD